MRARSIPKFALALGLASALLMAATGADRPALAREGERAAGERAGEERSAVPGPAALAIVSLHDQRISIYDAEGQAIRARVSSGQTDYETPVGVYSILQKNRDHYSNLYDDAQMPFMQRLTWSGIALHAGALPGYPASHGCVRLPYDFADRIFGLSKIGTRVIVAGEDVAPSEIDHPALWKPTTPGESRPATTRIAYTPDDEAAGRPFTPDLSDWPERQALFDRLASAAAAKAIEADAAAPELDELTKARDAKAAARAKTEKSVKRATDAKQKADRTAASAARRVSEARSDKARKSAESTAAKAAEAAKKADEKLAAATALDEAAEAELARATAAFDVADAVKKKARAAADEAKRKTLPMSVFVSLKAQRLYVRQGHEPVLDMPISIAEPEKPIGTHVFTAMDYIGDGNDVRWTVVSLRPRPHRVTTDDTARTSGKRRAAAEPSPPPTDVGPAKAALDRVTLPPEIVARASEYVWPGTSLIISDEELSKETGKATDFVVLISGEPQGGIKKRPRQQPNRYDPYYYYDGYYASDRYYNDRYYNDRRRRPRSTPFFSFW